MKFIDPRIDFAFRKIFGREETRDLLKSFLEAVMGLEGDKKLKEITLLNPCKLPRLEYLKISILDVKCTDYRDITCLVEMQIKKVKAFLRRVHDNLFNTCKNQIKSDEDYPKLNRVIGITITDFDLFPDFPHYLSCHTTEETLTNKEYPDEIMYYFLELSKFNKKEEELQTDIEKWSYFLKMTGSLEEVPEVLKEEPYTRAFEVARISSMTEEEYELYNRAAMFIAEQKDMIELALEEGFNKGFAEGIEQGIEKGKKEKSIDIAKKLFRKGLATEEISELTGLSLEVQSFSRPIHGKQNRLSN